MTAWARIGVLTAGLAALGSVATERLLQGAEDERAKLAEDWREEQVAATAAVAADINDALFQVYAGIRTMSRLPGVVAALEGDRPLGGEAHVTVQELYNNLATTVAVSEVYVVPADLDPDRVGGRGHTAPIVTFDELITGRSGGDREARDAEAHEGEGEEEEAEEVEIYEYRRMREQFTWFHAHAATAATVRGLDVPVLTGPGVITCDNHNFNPRHPDDERRTGLVISVPVFGRDGGLLGGVSAVLLDDAIRAMLPDGTFALRVGAHDLTLGKPGDTEWSRSLPQVTSGVADPGRLYSGTVKLALPDGEGAWTLWAGQPDTAFEETPPVVNARIQTRALLTVVWVVVAAAIAVAAATLLRSARRTARVHHVREVAAQAAGGRLDVRARLGGGDDVAQLGDALDQVITSVARMREAMEGADARLGDATGRLAPASGAIAEVASTTKERAVNAASSVGRVHVAMEEVVVGVQALDASIREVSGAAQHGQRVAEEAVGRSMHAQGVVHQLSAAALEISRTADVINAVAEKTRMLALNASVEAARAGTAGDGFSVVAREVKELALQTATAANRVREQVSKIEEESARAEEAMDAVRSTLSEMAQRQEHIAVVMQRQSAATTQVGAGAARVAHEAGEIRSVVEATANAANTAAEAAELVASISADVVSTTGDLRSACSIRAA